jgi:hypothetical protein
MSDIDLHEACRVIVNAYNRGGITRAENQMLTAVCDSLEQYRIWRDVSVKARENSGCTAALCDNCCRPIYKSADGEARCVSCKQQQKKEVTDDAT